LAHPPAVLEISGHDGFVSAQGGELSLAAGRKDR
jgi:hypothetical protein